METAGARIRASEYPQASTKAKERMNAPTRVNWYRISLFLLLAGAVAWSIGFAAGLIVILWN